MILENAENLTNKELVRIILENGFSTNKESSLLRYSKEDLLRTIADENDNFRSAQAQKDIQATEGFIDSCLEILDSIKLERDGKPNNRSAKRICKANLQDEAFMNEKNHRAFKLIFALSALCFLIYDTFNLKKYFTKNKDNINAKTTENKPA